MRGSWSGRRPGCTRRARRRSSASGRASLGYSRRLVERSYFGTDGVRGIVGDTLTVELVERLGKAATLWVDGGRIFIGRDTRITGPELEQAFARGVVSA